MPANMSRIGIRIAAQNPSGTAIAVETSSMSAITAGVRTEPPHGLLFRGGDVDCDTDVPNRRPTGSAAVHKRSSTSSSTRTSIRSSGGPTVSQWTLLPSIIFTCLIGFSSGGFHSNSNNHLNSIEASTPTPLRNLWADPYFDIMMPKNVTALVGKSAYLTCRVRNLGNRTVAWVRHRDIHVLTVNTYTYTSDQRFQTAHHKDTDEWTLQIKYVQERDKGTYECQVSTQPVKSYIVSLNVVEPHFSSDQYGPAPNRFYNDKPFPSATDWPPPRWSNRRPYNMNGGARHYGDYDNGYGGAEEERNRAPVPTASILGGPDLYVDKGSTINLTCAIRFSPEPPAYIFWYHLDQVISYDSTRGGVAVITDKGEGTTSYLLIQDAELTDSGKYSCAPSNADMTSVRVHVLNGERPEAMQTGSAGLSSSFVSIPILIIISSLYNSYRLTIQRTTGAVLCDHR